MNELQVALFPLHAVLFPGGPLPLRVFEPRYLELVSHCLRTESPFGVCLIESGTEVGAPPTPYTVGTLARIVDWLRLPDGLLGITVIGEQRFRILDRRVLANQLTEARVELLPEEPFVPLPAEYIPMADVLRQLVKHVSHLFADRPPRYDDSSWVGCRLAELLPFPLAQKQHLLQLDQPIQRLERVRQLMGPLNIQL